MNDWISVKERLPEKDGWYFVYAPEYWGNNKIYGLMALHIPTLNTTTKITGGLKEKWGKDTL